jgi:hypothetical protein
MREHEQELQLALRLLEGRSPARAGSHSEPRRVVTTFRRPAIRPAMNRRAKNSAP